MQSNESKPHHSCAYYVLKYTVLGLKAIACVALIANIVAYGLTIQGSVENKGFSDYEKSFIVLSCLGFMIICVMEIIAECEPKWFLKRVAFMKIMVIRGFLMGWQGIQSVDNGGSAAGKSVDVMERSTFRMFSNIIGWSLIACGFFFFIISTCQFQRMVGLYEDESGDYEAVAEASSSKDTKNQQKNTREPAPLPPAGSSILSPEARAVISNMAIALDITSSRAWDMFNGPAGAEEARRMRAERAQELTIARNASQQGNGDDRNDRRKSQPPMPNTNTNTNANAYSPREEPTPSNSKSARLLSKDEELAAQYYGSATKGV